jgi:hypothetical protein
MSERLQIRVPDGSLERWGEAAVSEGLSLPDLVRRRMEGGSIAQELELGFTQVRQDVARGFERLTIRVENLLAEQLERLGGNSPGFPPIPQSYPIQGAGVYLQPKAFQAQCDNFDIHRIGETCEICGGNGLARARPA